MTHMDRLTFMTEELARLAMQGNLRALPQARREGRHVVMPNGQHMLNLASNDYLGLAADQQLRQEYLHTLSPDRFTPSASASRLLGGADPDTEALEHLLAQLYGTEAALCFNSGWHANTGIIQALAGKDTLVLADKLVHASIIDGLRLAGTPHIRYPHNDTARLETLAERYAPQYAHLLVITESIFSMDGDEADLPRLAALRKRIPNLILYVDEAHALGVHGPHGLGLAEEQGCLPDVDLLVGTFGKALASAGAFVVCRNVVKEYLLNRARPFIFSTALPPAVHRWTLHVLRHLPQMAGQRTHLARLAKLLRANLTAAGLPTTGSSHIVPLLAGSSERAVRIALRLQAAGFYTLPVRPPTVPQGTARIRFSLTADMQPEELPTPEQLHQATQAET